MGKVKMHRASTSIDMTPMVDLAFLLVTFFMLTAQAIPVEPIAVDTPSSNSEIAIPDRDVLTVSVAKDGRVFFNVDGQFTRSDVLGKIGEQRGISFTPEEIHKFAVLSSFGVPIANLKQFLGLTPEQRKELHEPGIPVDSLNNELGDWVLAARLSNRKLRIAIKGDRDSNYPVVKKVIDTMIEKKVNRFNLITNMEKSGG